MKKSVKNESSFEIFVEKLVYGGEGLARHEGKVVFVPFSVPGDRLLVRTVEEKRSFIRAQIVRILKPGPGRVDPVCGHFQKCGGCHWQQLEYARQVEAKRQILEALFHHRFPQTRSLPIVMRASVQPFSYRSRARLQLRGTGADGSVGFFRCGSHSVEDVEACPLFRKTLAEALSSLRQDRLKTGQDPSLCEMDIASSEDEAVWVAARSTPAADSKVGSLPKGEDAVLRKKAGEFTYAVTASAFFQANDFMVPELVHLVQDLSRDAGQGLAFDLFAGVGLFSLPLARQFDEVVAVENSSEAIRLCARNAVSAGLGNIHAVCSDVTDWLGSLEARSRRADLILLDPPRTGAGLEAMDRIAELASPKIIYVSCDPQTLVRDLAAMVPRGYGIAHVEGLDMFPQTYHFETVVRLEKN